MTAYDARFYRSVADIGCGDGGWLAAFRAAGIDDILGFDGPVGRRDLIEDPNRSVPVRRSRCYGQGGAALDIAMIWNDSSISWWYRQNLVLFAADQCERREREAGLARLLGAR
jgi:hypothetical protein